MTIDAAPPLVSVIIPAYNAETRIAETLRSVVAQDYPNIEIIVVNDGSTDTTDKIVRDVLEASGREHKIIGHEKNMGVSAARNTGLDRAAGDYVTFFDADDLADIDHISSLLKAIKDNDADIAFCGFREVDADTNAVIKYHPVKLRDKCTYPEDFVIAWFNRKLDCSQCCLIYRKRFLSTTQLRFVAGCRYGEDTEFLLKALIRSSKTTYIDKMSYVYVSHAQQTSRTLKDISKARRLFHEDMAHRARVAHYFRIYARSDEVRRLTRCLFVPETLVKRFTFLARMRDHRGYLKLASALVRHSAMRKILCSSVSVFIKDPCLAIKAMTLLLSPRMYYLLRCR